MDTLVKIRDLHKVYLRGSERIDVLQGVNLDIPQGDFLALMGPSGSGKTTLLNLIGGLDTPTEGAIEVARRSHRQDVGRPALGLARAPHRLRVPAVQPAAGADRGAERRAAAAADEALVGRPQAARRRRRSRSSGWPIARSTTRASSRAARSSASASRARSSPTRRSCCATSRPAISIASRATRSSTCCRRSTASTARRS